MIHGIITKVTQKGFGFIRSEDLEKDCFFHASNCVPGTEFDTLTGGETVVFECKETDKGFIAVGVMLDKSGSGCS